MWANASSLAARSSRASSLLSSGRARRMRTPVSSFSTGGSCRSKMSSSSSAIRSARVRRPRRLARLDFCTHHASADSSSVADEQAVLARSDHGDVVPVEYVAAEWVDDLDGLITDPQPRMETESPDVQQGQHGEHDQQRRQPRRAAVPVDQVRQDGDNDPGCHGEDRYQNQRHWPSAPYAEFLLRHWVCVVLRQRAGAIPRGLQSAVSLVLR